MPENRKSVKNGRESVHLGLSKEGYRADLSASQKIKKIIRNKDGKDI